MHHEHWNTHGYLVVENVLERAEVSRLLGAIDEVLARRSAGHTVTQGNGAWKIDQAIAQTSALDPLVDHPRLLPLLLSLLGPFLQILGTEIFVREAGREPLVPWHTDGGATLARFLPVPGAPVLQMKAQFFLTDVTEDDCGNFMLVPGSHRRPFVEGDVRHAVQLRVHAGDVLLFPWSLWHAVAPNRGGVRKSVTFRYGQLWSRPYDYERLPRPVLDRMTPRQRRMFGDLGADVHPSGFFYVDEEEQMRILAG
ncbi:MAG TPA: phytanoyl-CoA dioxygenase family protein [Thermoanaerobaculia bacterium]